jgi:hypothetical protein
MRTPRALALIPAVALWACDSATVGPGPATTLSLHVSAAPALIAGVDAGTVRLEGPTSRTLSIRPGETLTIEGLLPGAYTVSLEATAAGLLAAFAETNVTVVAGENRPASLQLASFVPAFIDVPAEVMVGVPVTVQYGRVDRAESYRVEWADNPAFSNASSTDVNGTEATIEMVAEGAHHFRVRARNRFGSDGVPTAPAQSQVVTFDPCRWTVGSIEFGQTVDGTLGPGDCFPPPDGLLPGRFRDHHALFLPSAAAFTATIASPDFAPVVGALIDGGATLVYALGRTQPGQLAAEHVLPAGTYWLLVTSFAADQEAPPTGAYSLSTAAVDEPQVGCTRTTYVTGGSVANGRVTPEDCETEFEDPPGVTWRYDGYSIRLLAGQSVSVTLKADFPFRFSRFFGAEFQEWITDIPAGESRTFTVTGEVTGYHRFYVISEAQDDQAGYTMTFGAITGPAPAAAGPAGEAIDRVR